MLQAQIAEEDMGNNNESVHFNVIPQLSVEHGGVYDTIPTRVLQQEATHDSILRKKLSSFSVPTIDSILK